LSFRVDTFNPIIDPCRALRNAAPLTP
jgi:hypothetical protein